MDIKQRYLGAIFGLAVCDALGDQVQFLPRDTFPIVTEMTGGGRHRNDPGQWTDDTSMALCLAESLLRDGFSFTSQMEQYAEWLTDGKFSSKGYAFDVGRTTKESIDNWMYDRCMDGRCGSHNSNQAGNGAIIRLAPVPMYFSRESETRVATYSQLSAVTTHGCEEARHACRIFGAMIYRALHSKTKTEILAPVFYPGTLHEKIADINGGAYRAKERSEISSRGRASDTLEAALWCFHQTQDFESGAILAVNLGWDADSVGATYGQLAGAYYGYNAIPERWLKHLAKQNLLRSAAIRLYNHAKGEK